jgi:hypothetical protein
MAVRAAYGDKDGSMRQYTQPRERGLRKMSSTSDRDNVLKLLQDDSDDDDDDDDDRLILERERLNTSDFEWDGDDQDDEGLSGVPGVDDAGGFDGEVKEALNVSATYEWLVALLTHYFEELWTLLRLGTAENISHEADSSEAYPEEVLYDRALVCEVSQ